jgi:hypothetical protein
MEQKQPKEDQSYARYRRRFIGKDALINWAILKNMRDD